MQVRTQPLLRSTAAVLGCWAALVLGCNSCKEPHGPILNDDTSEREADGSDGEDSVDALEGELHDADADLDGEERKNPVNVTAGSNAGVGAALGDGLVAFVEYAPQNPRYVNGLKTYSTFYLYTVATGIRRELEYPCVEIGEGEVGLVSISYPCIYRDEQYFSCGYSYSSGSFYNSVIHRRDAISGVVDIVPPSGEKAYKKGPPRCGRQGTVAWWDPTKGFEQDDVRYYDFDDDRETLVTDAPYAQSPYDLSEKYLAYFDQMSSTFESSEVMLYEFSTMERIRVTNDDLMQNDIRINGDRVIWTDFRHGNWTYDGYWNADIYMYTISTGQTENLTPDGTADQEKGDIDGDFVAWTDLRHGSRSETGEYRNSEIYLMRLSDRRVWRITDTPEYNEFQPQLHGTAMIWYSQDFSDDWVKRQVYYFDFSHLLEGDGG